MPSKDAMATKDGAGQLSARRKSMHLFSRGSLNLGGLTAINTDVKDTDTNGNKAAREDNGEAKSASKAPVKKLSKRNSIFGLKGGPSSSPEIGSDGSMSPIKTAERSSSPKMRPRALQKGRPTSIFGSLGRKSINIQEDGEADNLTGSPTTPPEDGNGLAVGSSSNSKSVLYHGEIQTTSGMFRKKKEYLVLTETHLVRFKSQSRASETFPIIHAPTGRSSSTRHPSTTSIGSLQEVQSMGSHASSEHENRIPLAQIVSVYKVEDGRPFFTSEVVYLDEDYHGVGSLQLMLHDPKEADLWLTSIRGAAEKARLLKVIPYPERVVHYLVSALESVDDYSAEHFQVFRVVRRASAPKGNRSSSDDLKTLGSSVYYMVIGINRVHLIPVPEFSVTSNRLVPPKASRYAHGIVALVDLRANNEDDRFEMVFRTPLQGADCLELAASATQDIAMSLVRAWQYLKPLWEDFNFNFGCPKRIVQICESNPPSNDEELGCFDRTLVAYCMAYGCNPVNIQYSVDWEAEDSPEFALYPPRYSKKYSLPELLSVMRALRYNELFRSISFRDIDLHSLHGWIESNGAEHVATTTRTGVSLTRYFNIKPQEKSVLYQEIQALALKSSRLRRMDFTNTLPRRRPKDTFDIEGGDIDKDPGSEIVAALLPLCQGKLTNVSWIILNGIELGETDLDFLIPALNKPNSNIRAIECAHCGLNDRGIMQMVTHLERQNASIECMNISDNPGRIHLEQFQASMSRFTRIKKLNLSRTTWTKGIAPIFLPEVMLTWRLEELNLNGVMINEKTLNAISKYLASDASFHLHTLSMDQCNLNGDQVAILLHAMARSDGEARQIEFSINANRLEKGVSAIVEAIKQNHTPTHLYLRMIEFTKEDYFRQLLEALRTNTTIRCLDISKASLPYDAGPDTCEALRAVFAENKTLEDFDISGEQAHLEVTRFGIGLNHALTGLKDNDSLRLLRIEYQNLGLEGANTLSSVIEENEGLTHIFCEHNDINLQGFTTIVNALAKNYTILALPFLQDDQNTSMKRMNANMRDSRRSAAAYANRETNTMKSSVSSVRRTFSSLVSSSTTKAPKPELTPQDVDAVVRVLNERWEHEMKRLQSFLERNNNIAAGVEGWSVEECARREHGDGGLGGLIRPTTAMSDKGILEQVLSNTTPRVELHNPVDEHIIKEKIAGLGLSSMKEIDGEENENFHDAAEAHKHDVENKPPRYNPLTVPELRLPNLGNEKLFELGDDSGMFTME